MLAGLSAQRDARSSGWCGRGHLLTGSFPNGSAEGGIKAGTAPILQFKLLKLLRGLADGVGFEPTVSSRSRRFSRPVP